MKKRTPESTRPPTAAELVAAVEAEFGITLEHDRTPDHLRIPLAAFLERADLDIVDYIRARCDVKLQRAMAAGEITPDPTRRRYPR